MSSPNPARDGITHLAELMFPSQPVNLFQFFLDCGRDCQVLPLTMEEARYIAHLVHECGGYAQFQPGNCWQNAQRLMLKDDERRLEYCEGYFTGGRINNLPIHHGWCSINQKVVDLTARTLLRNEHRRERQFYWGIPLPFRFMLRQLIQGKVHAPITEPLRPELMQELKWDGPKAKKRGPKPKGEER
jgi:hypothetical protein